MKIVFSAMKRNPFLSLLLTPFLVVRAAAQQTDGAAEAAERDIAMHLAIWAFELRLNRFIPKKSFIEINPHTTDYLAKNIHRSLSEARKHLERDITLLLVIKKNQVIAEYARTSGIPVFENSFGKDEWPVWIALLKKMVLNQKIGSNDSSIK